MYFYHSVKIELVDVELPEGLMLTDGVISGTPQIGGTFSLTFRLSNSAGSVTKILTLIIASSSAPVSPDVPPKSDDVPPVEPPKSDDVPPVEPPKSDDVPPVEPPKSDDVSPDVPPIEPSKSDDVPPIEQPESDDIVIGPEREISSLSIYELAQVSNDRSMIAAILPEIEVKVSDAYDFKNIQLNEKTPLGALLVWNPFVRSSENNLYASVNASDEDTNSGIKFLDKNGSEITTVPANRNIDVSAYLEAGKTYAPVISAVIHENSEEESHDINTESHDVNNSSSGSSGGCTAGITSIILLSIIGLFMKKK